MTPLSALREKNKTPELESLIAKPYNKSLRKFVEKESEHRPSMFAHSLSYLRKTESKGFRKKLQRQMLRHFHPYSFHMFSCITRKKLPPKMHNRMILESFKTDDMWIREYFETYGAQE